MSREAGEEVNRAVTQGTQNPVVSLMILSVLSQKWMAK